MPLISLDLMKPQYPEDLIIQRTTPEFIWELMRDGVEDLSPLTDAPLPWEFAKWVRAWEKWIEREKRGVEGDVLEILGDAEKGKRDVGEVAREREQEYLLPLIPAYEAGRWEEFDLKVWEVVGEKVKGKEGWRR